jgi:hypothetical protein
MELPLIYAYFQKPVVCLECAGSRGIEMTASQLFECPLHTTELRLTRQTSIMPSLTFADATHRWQPLYSRLSTRSTSIPVSINRESADPLQIDSWRSHPTGAVIGAFSHLFHSKLQPTFSETNRRLMAPRTSRDNLTAPVFLSHHRKDKVYMIIQIRLKLVVRDPE